LGAAELKAHPALLVLNRTVEHYRRELKGVAGFYELVSEARACEDGRDFYLMGD
jgi:hypothetical protein